MMVFFVALWLYEIFTVNASLNAVLFYKCMGFEETGDVSLAG
jgi:hypothetical protein